MPGCPGLLLPKQVLNVQFKSMKFWHTTCDGRKAVIFHDGTGFVIGQPASTLFFTCWAKSIQISYDSVSHYKLLGEKMYNWVWGFGNMLNIRPVLKTRCFFSVSKISIVNNF